MMLPLSIVARESRRPARRNRFAFESLEDRTVLSANLVISAPSAPAAAILGEEIEVSWTVTNLGNEPTSGGGGGEGIAAEAGGGYWDTLYLSDDDTYDPGDVFLGEFEGDFLNPGESYARNEAVFLPQFGTGSKYLLIVTDNYDSQIESNESDNLASLAIDLSAPDLFLAGAGYTASGTIGQNTILSWTVQNQGSVTASANWFDHVYISADNTLSTDDFLLGSHDVGDFSPLAPGEQYEIFDVPFYLGGGALGNVFLIISTNVDAFGFGQQGEENVYPNAIVLPFFLEGPDLVVTEATGPTNILTPGEQIHVDWTVQNQGNAATVVNSWEDAIYVSADPFFDGSDTFLGSFSNVAGLDPGANYLNSGDVIFYPAYQGEGTQYLIIVADIYGYEPEGGADNNYLAIPISVQLPDLVVTTASAPSAAELGTSIDVEWTVLNQGTVPAATVWYDVFYLSDDTVYSFDDTFVGSYYNSLYAGLGSGESYSVSTSLYLPSTAIGSRYLLIQADGFAYQPETDNNNNTYVLPIELSGPDLVPLSALGPATGILSETISVEYTVQNQGNASTTAYFYDAFYVSDDEFLDASDTFITSVVAGNFGSPMAPSDSYTQTSQITLPTTGLGNRFLLIVADSYYYYSNYGYQPEYDETNNVLAIPLELFAPDLEATSLTAPASAVDGEFIPVTFTIENTSDIDAPASSWYDNFYLSDDAVFDYGDRYLAAIYNGGNTPLPAHSSYTVSTNITIQATTSGTKYLFLVADGYDNQGETNENNNVYGISITINLPDLVITSATAPAELSIASSQEFSWTVQNQGEYPAADVWYDSVYLSDDAILDLGDSYIGTIYQGEQSPLAAGASYTTTVNFYIPNVPTGNKYVIFATDKYLFYYYSDAQGETDETNNTYVLPVTVVAPDLVVTAASAPTNAIDGQNITIEYTVKNQGSGPAGADWYDHFYLSNDDVYDSSDVYQGAYYTTSETPLGVGDSYTVSTSFTVNSTTSGAKYLIIRGDGSNYQPEEDETNNDRAVPIIIGLPDLVVTDADAPATAAVGEHIAVSFTVTNQGTFAAPADWYDAVYLSDDAVYDAGDTLLTYRWAGPDTPLAVGASYTANVNFTIPNTPTGAKYLLFYADGFDNGYYYSQAESDENNNILAVALAIVPNSPPELDFIADRSVDEGELFTIQLGATDVDAWQTLTFSFDFSDLPAGSFTSFNGISRILTLRITDDRATPYTVGVTVTDNGVPAESDSQDFEVDVANVAPVMTAITAPGAVRGQTRTYRLFADDAAALDDAAGFTFDIDWNGDDIFDQTVSGLSGMGVDHVYTESGGYTMKVRATDKDGGVSNIFSRFHTIVDFQAQFNATTGLVDFAWGGTAGVDRIYFYNLDPAGVVYFRDLATDVLDTISGITGSVLAFGQGGDDTFLGGYLDNPIEFYGGAGSDLLIGGRGSDLLDGGDEDDFLLGGIHGIDGNDSLLGGAGRDILIGSYGADLLNGGGGEDMLIAGVAPISYVYESDLDAVVNIRAHWSSADTFANRVAAVESDVATYVQTDTDSDTVDGGADDDWYIVTSGEDLPTPLVGAEIKTEIGGAVPTVDFEAPTRGTVGEPIVLTLLASDPPVGGASLIYTFQITYADQSSSVTQTVVGTSGTTFNLVIPTLGDSGGGYGIVITATDSNGRTSSATIKGVVVEIAQSRSFRELGGGTESWDGELPIDGLEWLDAEQDSDAVDEALAAEVDEMALEWAESAS